MRVATWSADQAEKQTCKMYLAISPYGESNEVHVGCVAVITDGVA